MTNQMILISTSKPIMTVTKKDGKIKVEYLTVDRIFQTPKKKIFFMKEKLHGYSTASSLKKLINNELSIYHFMERLTEKNRQVFINGNEFKLEPRQNFEYEKSRLPDNSIYLKDMPNEFN